MKRHPLDKALFKLLAIWIARSELGDACEHMVAYYDNYMVNIGIFAQ